MSTGLRSLFQIGGPLRFQDFLEPIVADGDPLVHGGLENHVASFARLVQDGEGESSDTVLFCEVVGYQRLAGIPGIVKPFGGDEALGRDELACDTAGTQLLAVRTTPQEAIGTANARIDFADGHGPTWRAE